MGPERDLAAMMDEVVRWGFGWEGMWGDGPLAPTVTDAQAISVANSVFLRAKVDGKQVIHELHPPPFLNKRQIVGWADGVLKAFEQEIRAEADRTIDSLLLTIFPDE